METSSDKIIDRACDLRIDWLLFPFARDFADGAHSQEQWDKDEKPEYIQRVKLAGVTTFMTNYLSARDYPTTTPLAARWSYPAMEMWRLTSLSVRQGYCLLSCKPPFVVLPGLIAESCAPIIILHRDGEWRSLVARLLWEQEVAGSNPVSPTRNGDLQSD